MNDYEQIIDSDISIKFNANTQTIRQYPQNYLIASLGPEHGSYSWSMCPDLATNEKLVVATTLVLLKHQYKFATSQEAIEEMVRAVINSYQFKQENNTGN